MSASCLLTVAPGSIDANVQIPNTRDGGFHPHLVDFYVPNVAYTRAMVMLHGGSGSKEKFAANLAILKSGITVAPDNVRWDILSVFQVLGVFPQGQHCSGVVGPFNPYGINSVTPTNPDGIATWSDWVMWSQADDVQFLKDLKAYIIANYGAGLGVNLCGHSNGGMMVQRMWYESPGTFTHYCATSGPASDYYLSHPALPGVVQPFFQQVGLLDDVLDISGGPAGAGSHFYAAQWQQNPAQMGFTDVSYPGPPAVNWDTYWISEWAQLQTRVTAQGGGAIAAGDGVVTGVKIGTQTTWTYNAGKNVLQLISGAGHQIVSHEQCTGRRVFNDWINFIRSV